MILEIALVLSATVIIISAAGYTGILVLGKVDTWGRRTTTSS